VVRIDRNTEKEMESLSSATDRATPYLELESRFRSGLDRGGCGGDSSGEGRWWRRPGVVWAVAHGGKGTVATTGDNDGVRI
jgi:hypothetical protein